MGEESLAPQPAPRRARAAPGPMGPPLCAAGPAPRRAQSPPHSQVMRLGVLREGNACWLQRTGNSWVLEK